METKLREKNEQEAYDAFTTVLDTLSGASVVKNAKVKYGTTNFSYPDLPTVLAYVEPVLAENGFSLYSTADENVVTTICVHKETGVEFTTSLPLSFAKGSDPQALGSALTYFRRYNLYNLFNLKVADDDGKKAQDSMKASTGKKVPDTGLTGGKMNDSLEEMFNQ